MAQISELRRATRYHVKWRAALIAESKTPCYGYIKDISVTGALLLSEKAMAQAKPVPSVELHIEIPAKNADKARVLTIMVRIVYAVFDNKEMLFRYGMDFREYCQKSDAEFLGTHLTRYCQPVLITNHSIHL